MKGLIIYLKTKTALSLVLIVCVGIIIVLTGNLLGFVMFRYPFDPSVWGTVSDWSMVFVTLFTAVYLFKTFQSQKIVQTLQQSLTEIEVRKYLEEIQPDFLCDASFNDDGDHRIILTPIKKVAKNINYNFSQALESFVDISGHGGNINAQSNQILKPIIIYFNFNSDELDERNKLASLDIDYEDDIGTQYLLKFLIRGFEPETTKAGPILVNYTTKLGPRIVI